MKINNIFKSISRSLLLVSLFLPVTGVGVLSSCSESSSELVSFVEDNRLNSPNDTLYSLIGIINKLQTIADRTILLGEVRGDLTTLTENATLDLQDLANFSVDKGNPYNNARDYYAIIQNCNYFIANADTALVKHGEKVFLKEYAAIKAYRAWTYMQLAINYGSVPFVTEPLLTELQADPALYPKYDIKQMAEYFVKDLAKLVDTDYPSYGISNDRYFYIPIRVLLGDLCLWSGRYTEAATYYHDFLNKSNDTHPTGLASVKWGNIDMNGVIDFSNKPDGYANQFSSTGTSAETLTIIPMEQNEYDGIISRLADVFNSTEDNNYFYQATRSAAYDRLSQSQRYVTTITDPVTLATYTIAPSDTLTYPVDQYRGDLRQQSIYTMRSQASGSSNLSSIRQTVMKHRSSNVVIYRLQHVYLRYAEALNRAGHPSAAFAVLKYGLNKENNEKHLSDEVRAAAGSLISFDEYAFVRANTQGIHSRGCGMADEDSTYCIPDLSTREDSIAYVEERICDEMALETAAEGLRFYDLIRISSHRNDPSFLAGKVARRNGTLDESLYSKLLDPKNWYLSIE